MPSLLAGVDQESDGGYQHAQSGRPEQHRRDEHHRREARATDTQLIREKGSVPAEGEMTP